MKHITFVFPFLCSSIAQPLSNYMVTGDDSGKSQCISVSEYRVKEITQH